MSDLGCSTSLKTVSNGLLFKEEKTNSKVFHFSLKCCVVLYKRSWVVESVGSKKDFHLVIMVIKLTYHFL